MLKVLFIIGFIFFCHASVDAIETMGNNAHQLATLKGTL